MLLAMSVSDIRAPVVALTVEPKRRELSYAIIQRCGAGGVEEPKSK